MTGAGRYRSLAITVVLLALVQFVGLATVGAQVAEGDVVRFLIDGPGGPREGDEPLAADGTASHDFGIDSYGTYTWTIVDEAGEEIDAGTIVVDAAGQPCAAGDLDEDSSCAGVTHSAFGDSPSYITVATRRAIVAPTTTAPSTSSTAPAPSTAPASSDSDDGESDDSSTPWVPIAAAGSGLILIGIGLTKFFGSSRSDSSDDDAGAAVGGGEPATIVPVPATTSAEPEVPVCRVEVQANEINGLGVHHLCLIFHDRHGARYFRGGPGEMTLEDGLLGRVTGTTGKHVPGAVDWEPGCPTVLIAEGPDVCAKKELLFAELRRINRMGANYELEGPNSNTTVRRLLRAAGLPERKPDVSAPGWDHDGLDPSPPEPAGPGPQPAPAPVPHPPSPPSTGGPGK